MSDTKLISLRVPNGLLAEIDAQARRESRSRAQVIVMRLQGVIVTRVEVAREPSIHPSSMERPVTFIEMEPEPQHLCRSCEGAMGKIKGKWVCRDQSCSMCGMEQGRAD